MGIGSEWTFFQGRCTDGQQVYEKMLQFTYHQGNANHKTTVRCYLTPVQIPVMKKTGSVADDVEKMEPLCTIAGIVNWYSQYKKL